ncbi:conserved hypothetical protein [Ricinus communis]|uniref:Uncharacterized protein n=1 Tax=Ricinus communis TaxID=3988 RepID=B9S9P5_RICCO|nr:conserved hypothetical protein [Ricinus communis]
MEESYEFQPLSIMSHAIGELDMPLPLPIALPFMRRKLKYKREVAKIAPNISDILRPSNITPSTPSFARDKSKGKKPMVYTTRRFIRNNIIIFDHSLTQGESNYIHCMEYSISYITREDKEQLFHEMQDPTANTLYNLKLPYLSHKA